MKRRILTFVLSASLAFGLSLPAAEDGLKPLPNYQPIPGRWSVDKANAWYDSVEWPVGANFVPSTAINQLEMWQAETFDPETIDRELGWAASIGMNSMRTFLHDIPWREDREGFFARVDKYLEIADKHGIRTMFVIFDAVWNPLPKAGKQPEPTPGLHNSGWVQSPGKEILGDPKRHDELKPYVIDVISRYKDDKRVLIWDLFNEPDNSNVGKWISTPAQDLDWREKNLRAVQLLEKTYRWAREVNPSQPLTSGVWGETDWFGDRERIEQVSLLNSDVISFHTYDNTEKSNRLVRELLNKVDRPLLCTEYMARGAGSTFEGTLPTFHQNRIGAYNWGLVNGKSQTIYPWDSWKQAYTEEPNPWFHDIFRKDGTPYRKAEVQLIKKLTDAPIGKTWETPGPESRQAIEKALKAHGRAIFVKSGWIRDPFITLGPDGNYYLTGTTPLPGEPREKTDPYNTGLGPKSIVGWKMQVWRSPDLIDWESLDAPYSLKTGIWAQERPKRFEEVPEKDWRLWAPELHWLGDRWAIVHTSPDPVAGANLSLTKGLEIKGPYENPMGTKIGRRHDPSLFKDDDGTWWMIWGATSIAPLKPDFSDFASKPVNIGPSGDTSKMGHEGCLMFKVGGKYVLFGTGWSTGEMRRGSYNLYYATADKITGPYSERKFAGRFLGHGTPFQDKQGRWWCTAFYNGNVPPLPKKGIKERDISETAQTINQQGVTLVPMDVRVENGEVIIRAKAPLYAEPGPDEAQDFGQKAEQKRIDALLKPVPGRWSKAKANKWYAELPWLVGCNYYPATAINQIDMWQASTWDPETIAKELGWAQSIGMNTLRVYLHDLVWGDDEQGLYQRMDQFLDICKKHSIRPSFVFFDDCHYPEPKLGPQPLPVAKWHNSGWVNSPARDLALRYSEGRATKEEVAHLKGYVQRTIKRFANDDRVLYWELYNEPGRGNTFGGIGSGGIGEGSNQLVHDSWVWAREIAPSQPITSCTAGNVGDRNIAINRANSDIHSIHNYGPPAKMAELIKDYQQDGRPVIMTEWLGRTTGSTVQDNLPVMKAMNVGAINWGFVSGESGTVWPWTSRRGPDGPMDVRAKRKAGDVVKPGEPFPEPEVWFHDIFRTDGTPFDPEEIKVFKELTKDQKGIYE